MELRVDRRLAAILCADVVGYSRLIERDETRTLHALRSLRSEIVDPLFADHGGRIVQVAGDGVLVEFASVVDAVQCAAAVQQAVQAHQGAAPPESRLVLRIGINLGDVVAEGTDILGDGVNVAARLEQLCEPGGVLVSDTVREHIGNRLDLTFEDLGPRALKNIVRPVRVHRLLLPDQQSQSVVVGPWPARVERSKPSVTVLPFENLSRDPDEDYFGEGIAEDLITDLSKISGLVVAGRRSTFAARRTPLDAVEASARQQVGHVLEGSVRRAGNRIRITARLVDGATGAQVWAERYDRTLDDIFAVQDDITHQIVAALQVNLLPTEKAALAHAPTTNIEAYGDYLRGLELLAGHVKPSYTRARRMFSRAVELDPDFARALAGIAECDCDVHMHFGEPVSFDEILATTARALELEPGLASAHASRGVALLATGRADEAERSFQRAIAAEPEYGMAHYFYGRACVELGRKQDAVRLLRRAAELSPDDAGFLGPLPALYHSLGMRAEAEAASREVLARCERELARQPDLAVAAYSGAGALAYLGERDRALAWAKRALAVEPDDHLALYNVACTYAVLGLAEDAIDLLERTMPGAGSHRLAWMKQDGDLDPLREHPRYMALLRRLDPEA